MKYICLIEAWTNKSFNMAESACLQCPKPLTEATVLVRPFLLQIDTFGKWCRCLHNVCYLKLKKRRYLDKCRLSAPAEASGNQSLVH